MADVAIRYLMANRKVRAQLVEQSGTPANLSAGGTVVTLHLTRVDTLASVTLTSSVSIDDANAGKVSILLVNGDFVAGKLEQTVQYYAWFTVSPTPAGSDEGAYSDGPYDTWTVTI